MSSGFDPESSFVVPDEVYDFYHKTAAKGAECEKEWNELFKKYSEKFEKEASEVTRLQEKRLPEGWQKVLPVYSPYPQPPSLKNLTHTVKTMPWQVENCPKFA